MKKRILSLFLLFLMLPLIGLPAKALSVEQAGANMPEISLFLHDDNGILTQKKAEDFTASLDGQPLKVEKLTPSEEGVFYVFMLDISRSIPTQHFEAAKKAVMDTYTTLRPQDRLAVISFGDKVTLMLNGTEGRDEAQKALEALKGDNSYTSFYGAMKLLIDTASAEKEMRRCAVVISDGISTGDADMSESELEQLLQKSGVAVYALSIDTASAQDTEAFRSFIRISGGELYPFSPADVGQKLKGLLERIGGVWQLELSAESNLADGAEHTLTVETAGEQPITTQITTKDWIPDETAPTLTEQAADVGAGTIRLTFSEPMLGLDQAANYQLTDPKGKKVSLTVESSDATGVLLKAEGLKEEAGWQLELSGITDRSMEKNPLKETKLNLFGAAAEETKTPAETHTQAVKSQLLGPILIIAAVILAVAAAVGSAVFYTRHKKPKPEKTQQQKNEKPETPETPQTKVRFYFENHEKNRDKK